MWTGGVAPVQGCQSKMAGSPKAPLLQVAPSRFTCRTLTPWRETAYGVSTAAGFRLWFNEVAGACVTWKDVQGVRAWCEGARQGDVLYMNDELQPVPADMAEIAIRCNV